MANRLSYVDLQERVARKLRILADTEQLSAEDAVIIMAGLHSVEMELDALGIANLHVEDGINEPYADPVAMMCAAHVADEFQVPDPYRSQLKAEGMIGLPGRSMAERRLRAMIESPTTKLAVSHDVYTV